MLSQRCRSTVAFVALVSLTACTTWEPYTLQPDVELPSRVRLHLISGERVDVTSGILEGDTAFVWRMGREGPLRKTPLRLVASMEEPHVSRARTAALVIVLVPVAFLALFYVGCTLGDCYNR
jgi:hypothetical protein